MGMISHGIAFGLGYTCARKLRRSTGYAPATDVAAEVVGIGLDAALAGHARTPQPTSTPVPPIGRRR